MEKDIEAYLRRKVAAADGMALKFVSPGWSGAPDRILLLPGGRAVFAETKDTGKVPGLKQRLRHDQLRALGFKVYVPDSYTAVDEMMREVVPGEIHTA